MTGIIIAVVIVIILIVVAWFFLSSPSHTRFVGWNFPYNDIEHADGIYNVKGLSEPDCVKRCQDTDGCVGTHYWPGDDEQESHCWAKTKLIGGYETDGTTVTHVMDGYEIPTEGNDAYYASL